MFLFFCGVLLLDGENVKSHSTSFDFLNTSLLSWLRVPRKLQNLVFEDAIFPELAVSGRALALGSAFISKVDDSSAPFL